MQELIMLKVAKFILSRLSLSFLILQPSFGEDEHRIASSVIYLNQYPSYMMSTTVDSFSICNYENKEESLIKIESNLFEKSIFYRFDILNDRYIPVEQSSITILPGQCISEKSKIVIVVRGLVKMHKLEGKHLGVLRFRSGLSIPAEIKFSEKVQFHD